MDIVKKVNYRYNIVYKFPSPVLDDLLKLAKRSPHDNLDVFRKDYGKILGYLKKPDVTQVVAALYLSEYIMKANFKKKGSVCGYHLSFLLKEAGGMDDKKDWKALNVVLACCVYGIVLFPNEVKFVDENIVAIFIQRSHVPTLLGDFYHSIHSRSYKGKDGVVHCCAPLLYHWFRSHLLCQGVFVDIQDTLKWSQSLMGLTSKDIDWYKHSLSRSESKEVIFSCGEFPNVPVMGMRGGINYNPTISQRQLGYALKDPPKDKDVLLAKNEELGVKLLVASQEKSQLSHKLKKVQREVTGVVKFKKRSRFEDGREITYVSVEVHKEVLEEDEDKIKRKHRDYEVLKASKSNMEKRYRDKIEESEKKLQAKDFQFEEKNTQMLGVETQLKGSNIQLGNVVEEVASLKVQLEGKDDDPTQILLPECNECEKLIEQC
ncbi:uncharacterized protein LOC127104659 [Lathyrus oleraceus]|uniref:uncharacterized protein LOC127104659 n=1 Tax=Pisum sativum TaxID=3888 RepID=UPI0021D18A3F|nr:uncharacterized protein LOC127104659 [Pisum sativum]